MAAVAMPHSNMEVPQRDEHTMDTRTPSPGPRSPHADGASGYQPDLSQEVSLLSTKLINAINYQTNLDDSLQHTRHELEAANRENVRLRAEKKSLDDMIANGLLIRKSLVDKTVSQLRAELAKERAAREEAERARKQTDAELENLTTALFEEANTMVAAARKDTEAVEKRNSQLKGQISDTEALLASQQEQLQDLKLTMGRMSERGDNETAGRDSIPSTPVGSHAAMFDAMQLSPNAAQIADIPPEHPLYFSQLLTPVLRNDIPSYVDFQDLLQTARKAASHSRAGSGAGNSSGALSSGSSQVNLAPSTSPSLPGAFSFSSSPSPQSATFGSTAPPLKDSKFYKRSLVEDIEPTLRLDLAPGLSFLSRRTVLSSLLLGSMVVEPFMPQAKFYGPIFACALCGESRKNEPYTRKHRFRTSEEDSAQRYPLCDYCLGRTRAAGDFVGFLRMVRDGHWRAETEDEQKSAWEEAVRLRERMFWARQGGGVVPSLVKQGTPSTANLKSARQSLESIPEQQSPARRASLAVQAAQAGVERREGEGEEEVLPRGEVQAQAQAEKAQPDEKLLGVFKSHRQSMSLGGALREEPAPQREEETVVTAEPAEIGGAESGAGEAARLSVGEPVDDAVGDESTVIVHETETEEESQSTPEVAEDASSATAVPSQAVEETTGETLVESVVVVPDENVASAEVAPVETTPGENFETPEEADDTAEEVTPKQEPAQSTTEEDDHVPTKQDIIPEAREETTLETVAEVPAETTTSVPEVHAETAVESVTEVPTKETSMPEAHAETARESVAEVPTEEPTTETPTPAAEPETASPQPPSEPEPAPASTPSTLQAPSPQPTERRTSSVLARVRAMESQAKSPTEELKPPGSFD